MKHLDPEIERRTNFIGILPFKAAVMKLAVASLRRQSNRLAIQRCGSMKMQTAAAVSDADAVRLGALPIYLIDLLSRSRALRVG